MRTPNITKNRGQALIMLLVFAIISITLSSAAVIITFLNSQTTSSFERGIEANNIAESGAENAILRLLRNPDYIGEKLPVGSGYFIATVSGQTTKTITSTGISGHATQKVQVVVQYTNNVLTVSSWQDIP